MNNYGTFLIVANMYIISSAYGKPFHFIAGFAFLILAFLSIPKNK